METAAAVLGFVLMGLGVCLVLIAVFRTLAHRWTLGVHELWLLPVVGVALLLWGGWLIR
jgi:hypothetical protein